MQADEIADLAGRLIAIARDTTHGFIYPANVDTLREPGAEIHFFSPLADDSQSVASPQAASFKRPRRRHR